MADGFPQIEFEQSYEQLRHYMQAHRTYLTMYLSGILALLGGILLSPNVPDLHILNFLSLFGIIVTFLFSGILINNRFYLVLNLRKLSFLRRQFLYSGQPEWTNYIMFQLDNSNLEIRPDHRILERGGSLKLTLALMTVTNCFLFVRIKFSSIIGIFSFLDDFWMASLIAFIIIQLLFIQKLSNNKEEQLRRKELSKVEVRANG